MIRGQPDGQISNVIGEPGGKVYILSLVCDSIWLTWGIWVVVCLVTSLFTSAVRLLVLLTISGPAVRLR